MLQDALIDFAALPWEQTQCSLLEFYGHKSNKKQKQMEQVKGSHVCITGKYGILANQTSKNKIDKINKKFRHVDLQYV